VALGAILLWLNMTSMLSFVGLALIGLALAPIFPSLIATTPERLGSAHTANGVGLQIAAAVLGQALLPGMMGMLARHLGLEIVGPALLDVHFVNPSPVFCLDKTGDCSHPKATHMSILPGSRQGSCLCQSLMLLQ
jgi:hypothetical protein